MGLWPLAAIMHALPALLWSVIYPKRVRAVAACRVGCVLTAVTSLFASHDARDSRVECREHARAAILIYHSVLDIYHMVLIDNMCLNLSCHLAQG